MVTIVDGKKRITYMRGMLVQYLFERGFAYDEAFGIADAVRTAFNKRKNVDKKELIALIDELIGEQNGAHQVGDLVFWERLPTATTVESSHGAHPFSKEILANSIQASGVAPDQAYGLAREIESTLIDQRRSRIGHLELEDLTEEMLQERHGPECAQRYRVWRIWGNLERPLFILIGGASGAGKTSLAINLANILNIPRVVATDDIRQIMHLMLSSQLMPSIHTSSYAVETDTTSSGADKTLVGYREQAQVVSVGVQAILARCLEENTSVIIDGVHLLPDFVDAVRYDNSAFLVHLALSLPDRQAYEARFAKRATEAPARAEHRYIAHLDEIIKIQDHILESSLERGIPVIDTSTGEEATREALLMIVEQLQEQELIKKKMGVKQRKKRVK